MTSRAGWISRMDLAGDRKGGERRARTSGVPDRATARFYAGRAGNFGQAFLLHSPGRSRARPWSPRADSWTRDVARPRSPSDPLRPAVLPALLCAVAPLAFAAIAHARPHSRHAAPSRSATATAPRRSRSPSATARCAATRSSCARRSPPRSSSALKLPTLKIAWKPVDARRASTTSSAARGRRVRHDDDHAVAHGAASTSACRSSSTAAARWCARDRKIAQARRSASRRKDRGDSRHHDRDRRSSHALNLQDATATLVPVKDGAEGVAAAVAGKVDAYAGDRMVLARFRLREAKGSELGFLDNDFSYEPYGIVLRRDDPEFRLAVNRALVELYKRGEIDPIFHRWLAPLGRPGPLLNAMFYLNATAGVTPAHRAGRCDACARGDRRVRAGAAPTVATACGVVMSIAGHRAPGMDAARHDGRQRPRRHPAGMTDAHDADADRTGLHEPGHRRHRRRGRRRVCASGRTSTAAALGRHAQDGAAAARASSRRATSRCSCRRRLRARLRHATRAASVP